MLKKHRPFARGSLTYEKEFIALNLGELSKPNKYYTTFRVLQP